MRRRAWALIAVALPVLSLLLGLSGGILLERRVLSNRGLAVNVPPSAQSEFELMAEAWRIVEREYVNQERVEPQQMAYAAVDGMVQTLGDAGHTRFLNPDMARLHRTQIRGQFEGIGAYVEMEEGRVVIVAPVDNSPAQRAGLEPGDVIIAVNGEDVAGLPLDEVVSRVIGPAGTEVTLTILDPGTEETREVTLERAQVDLDLATWQRLPETDVAYLRIAAFSDGASDELNEILAEVREVGIEAIVLDLRNNPGGLLSEAVAVASHFVESGDVLLRRDGEGNVTAETVKRGVDAVDLPVVVLANGGTASAAEIVTGALQDQGRARVVGTTTFGAGTVLNEFDLSGGSLLLIAVEEWLTPEGRVIWQKGLSPDVDVGLPTEVEALFGPGEDDITAEDLMTSGDTQLLRALELLEQAPSP